MLPFGAQSVNDFPGAPSKWTSDKAKHRLAAFAHYYIAPAWPVRPALSERWEGGKELTTLLGGRGTSGGAAPYNLDIRAVTL